MKWRDLLILACGFVVSVALLAVIYYTGYSTWIDSHLHAEADGDSVLWQVQTTFLSVGFAGLAIAAQLFAEAPLAIGASRSRVLEYIHVGRFVGVGLVANAVIAIETIWFSSDTGVIGVTIFWFMPTLIMLVLSTVRLMQLFGHPSRLDEVVRLSLVDTLSDRLSEGSRKYASAREQLEDLKVSSWTPDGASFTLTVPVPEAGRVIKSINPKVVHDVIDSLGVRAAEGSTSRTEGAEVYVAPQVTLDVEPGDRTRLGETAFRVVTSEDLNEATTGRVLRRLQSSIEFEPSGSVTPEEETDREIANLKDAIGTNLRSGAFATAERALELLGHVVRGVWMTQSESRGFSRRASFTRRDWLFRSLGEVERDALLSPRAAGMFVSAAMTRALEAPRVGSTDYVDDCLRSLTRLWFEVLKHGGSEFESVSSRILICVQNLAAYSYASADKEDGHEGDLQARAIWAMVELAKLALDAKKPEEAMAAAEQLSGLCKFDRDGSGRSHVRGGQLVISGWLDYLADKQDARSPVDLSLREMVTPQGKRSEILSARSVAERGTGLFSRWDWWEMKTISSNRAQALQLSSYIDRAQLSALTLSYGPLPSIKDQEMASEYKRFRKMLTDADRELSGKEEDLVQILTKEIEKWDAAEDRRLDRAPLSEVSAASLRRALHETLEEERLLAVKIPTLDEVPATADTSRPILGMNFRVPKHYLVDEIFNQTYADPADLGHMISRAFTNGEDEKIVSALRSLQDNALAPKASIILQQINGLGDQARHFVLVTPYGAIGDLEEWNSIDFRGALARVTHIETGVLDGEAFLFDRRSTLMSCRRPEEKEGLFPVEGTSIALGVFDDVQDEGEPHVRIETGEYFVVWPGAAPCLYRFGSGLVSRDESEFGDETMDAADG